MERTAQFKISLNALSGVRSFLRVWRRSINTCSSSENKEMSKAFPDFLCSSKASTIVPSGKLHCCHQFHPCHPSTDRVRQNGVAVFHHRPHYHCRKNQSQEHHHNCCCPQLHNWLQTICWIHLREHVVEYAPHVVTGVAWMGVPIVHCYQQEHWNWNARDCADNEF